MSNIFENFNSLILVAIGSVCGACLRLQILNYLESIFARNYINIAIVNFLATFLLGASLPFFFQVNITNYSYSYSLWLIFSIGFLGALSTFSSFIIELVLKIKEKQWIELLFIIILSLVGAIIFASFGFNLGISVISFANQ